MALGERPEPSAEQMDCPLLGGFGWAGASPAFLISSLQSTASLPMGLMRFVVPRPRLAANALERAYFSGMDDLPWQSRSLAGRPVARPAQRKRFGPVPRSLARRWLWRIDAGDRHADGARGPLSPGHRTGPRLGSSAASTSGRLAGRRTGGQRQVLGPLAQSRWPCPGPSRGKTRPPRPRATPPPPCLMPWLPATTCPVSTLRPCWPSGKSKRPKSRRWSAFR